MFVLFSIKTTDVNVGDGCSFAARSTVRVRVFFPGRRDGFQCWRGFQCFRGVWGVWENCYRIGEARIFVGNKETESFTETFRFQLCPA